MSNPQVEDYCWLTSPDAASWIEMAASHQAGVALLVGHLRRHLTPTQTSLILSLVDLRRRARTKFPDAEKMFFTDRGLQQATDEVIATYKAGQFPAGPILDLCSGIGGDLLAMARRGPVSAYELDSVCAHLSHVNVRTLTGREVAVQVSDCVDAPVEAFAAWHIDPDRRPGGRRRSQPSGYQPSLHVVEQLLRRNPHALLKLAPAAKCPAHWEAHAELEWIGHRRECQQLLVRQGRLARGAGRRSATILVKHGGIPRTVCGPTQCAIRVADTIQRYVFEPHAAVRAARLGDVLAADFGLRRVTLALPYLTGDDSSADPAMSCFEVLENIPMDYKRVRAMIRAHDIGQLEIKLRGTPQDPDQLRRRLSARGSQAATLLILPIRHQVRAVLTKRLSNPESSGVI